MRRTPKQTPKGETKIVIPRDPTSRKVSQLSEDSNPDKTELWERERQKRIMKEQKEKQRRLE